MIRSLLGLATCLLLAACASTKSPFVASPNNEDPVIAEQRKAIETAQSQLQSQNWSAAEEQFTLFIRKYPVSFYSAQAFYGRGRALEGLGQPAAAIQVYRQLGEQARTAAPEFAARAYVRMSYCHESLGDEARLQAALADAEKLADALPSDVRYLEIPTRKAASLMRMGRRDEARRLLAKVEKDLPDVRPTSPDDQRLRHAEILANLGTLDVKSVTPENFLPTLEALQALQPFLWKAITLRAGAWSNHAADQLRAAYFNLAGLAFSPPKVEGGRSQESSARYQAELQKKWVARLLESSAALKTYAGGDLSEGGESLVTTLAQIEENGRKILWGRQSLTPLTEESKVHQNPRKDGRVVSEPMFDAERGAEVKDPPTEMTEPLIPAPKIDAADPNLKEGRP